ncbi:MAG TPA: phenylacetyl CoA, partial [Kiloniellales bacterium]
LNVLFHPQTSWMSRESIIGLALFPLALAGAWFEAPTLLLPAAVAALGYLYCQARILRAMAGIPAWRVDEIVPLMMTTGLCEGLGLFLAVLALVAAPARSAMAVAAVVLLVLLGLRAWAWGRYRRALAESAPNGTVAELARLSPGFLVLGHVVPGLMLLGTLAVAGMAPVAATAGLLATLAGWTLKFVIVTRASYNQGFAIAHSPERGAGAAGLGAKPGWSVAS